MNTISSSLILQDDVALHYYGLVFSSLPESSRRLPPPLPHPGWTEEHYILAWKEIILLTRPSYPSAINPLSRVLRIQ